MDINILSSLVAGDWLIKSEKNIYSTTQVGREVEQSAKILTKALTQAISDNKIDVLFTLEHYALERDIACYGDADKRNASIAGLEQIAKIFKDTSTIDGAKDYLISTHDGKTLPKKIPENDVVRTGIKTRKAYLGQMIGATSSPALKLYHSRRKDALEHIKKEYVKNLNRGLGKEIGNDKGIER